MNDMKTITVYSGPSCAPCRVAYKRLDDAGIPYEVVDLSENEVILDELKRRLGRPKINTPLIQFGTKFGSIVDLTQIMAEYQEQSAQPA